MNVPYFLQAPDNKSNNENKITTMITTESHKYKWKKSKWKTLSDTCKDVSFNKICSETAILLVIFIIAIYSAKKQKT